MSRSCRWAFLLSSPKVEIHIYLQMVNKWINIGEGADDKPFATNVDEYRSDFDTSHLGGIIISYQ